jgi:hypothetical protein
MPPLSFDEQHAHRRRTYSILMIVHIVGFALSYPLFLWQPWRASSPSRSPVSCRGWRSYRRTTGGLEPLPWYRRTGPSALGLLRRKTGRQEIVDELETRIRETAVSGAG